MSGEEVAVQLLTKHDLFFLEIFFIEILLRAALNLNKQSKIKVKVQANEEQITLQTFSGGLSIIS